MIKVTTANEGGTLALGLDPYEVLGVDRNATKAQIARARHRLSREYHPDVNSDPGAAARFVEIQQAFELLSDPVARAAYDRVPGILIEPSSVNFGVLESGQPGVGAEVAVSWTGAPPGRIKSDPGGDWWTVMRAAMPDPSCVVFFLQAQAVAGTPNGRRDDRFTVTLDDMTVVVDLTAEIRGVPPPAPPPTFETARRVPPAPRPATGSPGCALAFGLTAFLLLILMFVLFSGGGGGGGGGVGGGGDTASATPPVRPVRVPQARAAAIDVRPVFTASEYTTNEPDAIDEGLAGPPVQRGSEILLSALPLPGFDFSPSFFCVAVTVPDTSPYGAEGLTFVESPVATVAVGDGKDLAYPAILPGAYVLDPNCTPSLSETETFPLGSVTVSNLGVVDAASTGFDNAMVIFAAHTSGATTTVTYGAIGGVDDLSLFPPSDDACIDSDSTTSQATYWQPVRALVSQQITGKRGWFSTGTLVFHGTRANSPQGTFFYDCAEANAENNSLLALWGIPVP
jgi:hypothetical protein